MQTNDLNVSDMKMDETTGTSSTQTDDLDMSDMKMDETTGTSKAN
jgi:hypothetical protein